MSINLLIDHYPLNDYNVKNNIQINNSDEKQNLRNNLILEDNKLVVTNDLIELRKKSKVDPKFCHECGDFFTKNHAHGTNMSTTCLLGYNINFYHSPEKCSTGKNSLKNLFEILSENLDNNIKFHNLITTILNDEASKNNRRTLIYWLHHLKHNFPKQIRAKNTDLANYIEKRMKNLNILYIAQSPSMIETLRRLSNSLDLKIQIDEINETFNEDGMETYTKEEILQFFPSSEKKKKILNNQLIK